MPQHFLLTPLAKTLSLASVMRLSEAEARAVFAKIRWPETDGAPICPECGGLEHYALKSRPVWKCKACAKQFSLTSGTMFHSRKLEVRDILAGIAIFANGAKGVAALQLSRDLRVDYKTSFVLAHKIREAMAQSRDDAALEGTIEIDGMHVGGYVKPANRREDRKDRRKIRNGKRQVVVAMRERGGRTKIGVAKSEHEGVAMAVANIKPDSVVHADEASHWDVLSARFEIKRINHQEAYSKADACTNGVESFFSRLRRAEIGTHHHIAGAYIASYAQEMSWREDHRRVATGTQFSMIVESAAIPAAKSAMRGYWQRRAR